jgi:Sulfate permease family
MDISNSVIKRKISRRESLLQVAKELPPCERGYLNHEHNLFDFRFSAYLPFFSQVSPIIVQLREYSFALLLCDLQAGLSVASILTPQAIAMAGLAGVKPIAGIISSIYPLVLYSLFGASKNLGVGPELQRLYSLVC